MREVKDLLLELGTEELPPKELPKLELAFCENIVEQLKNLNLSFTYIKSYATPRRIAVIIKDLDESQQDSTSVRRGPAVQASLKNGEPTKALLGFAKSCGVNYTELSTIETDKGSWYQVEVKIKGKSTKELIPEVFKIACDKLPIKKRMTWSDMNEPFVRPVQWIVAVFGNDIIEFELFRIKSNNKTHGHRFLSSKTFEVTADNYEAALEQNSVIANFNKRKSYIKQQLEEKAKENQAIVKISDELLTEVTGLVELPQILMASFERELLRVPKECLISSMEEHQRCFSMEDSKGDMLNKFLFVSNIKSTQPEVVISGNEKVMRARLQDAAFFYDSDLKLKLSSYLERLNTVKFEEKLGSIGAKSLRVEKLSAFIASKINANVTDATLAAKLCKADLLSNMVQEFPELQGIMGCYYAKNDGLNDTVALAIKEHYLPRFAEDKLPSIPEAICVALADRIDSLVGLFGVDKEPTGEKDPFGLRRQALAVIKILIENSISLDLAELFNEAQNYFAVDIKNKTKELVEFCLQRQKALYHAQGINPKLFEAVYNLNITTPSDFEYRIKALLNFSNMEESQSLAAANKRVKNILEKNASSINIVDINTKLLVDENEKLLYEAINSKTKETKDLVAKADYSKALVNLASLREVVDSFFDNVMVMADDPNLKQNRISLLNMLRSLFLNVADISVL